MPGQSWMPTSSSRHSRSVASPTTWTALKKTPSGNISSSLDRPPPTMTMKKLTSAPKMTCTDRFPTHTPKKSISDSVRQMITVTSLRASKRWTLLMPGVVNSLWLTHFEFMTCHGPEVTKRITYARPKRRKNVFNHEKIKQKNAYMVKLIRRHAYCYLLNANC